MDDRILHQMDRGREFTSFITLWLGRLVTGWFDWRDYHPAPFPWVLEDIIFRALTPLLPPPPSPLYVHPKKSNYVRSIYTLLTNILFHYSCHPQKLDLGQSQCLLYQHENTDDIYLSKVDSWRVPSDFVD